MKTPLYDQLYRFILNEITSGRLNAGDRVPSEKELAAQFQVSRITSKRALEKLYHDQIIDRVQGKGSFVRQSADVPHGPAVAKRIIGLILPDFSHDYGLQLIQAIEEYCSALDYWLIVKRTYGQRALEEKAIQVLGQFNISGLIIFPVHGEFYNTELLRLLLSGFPVVLVDRYLKGIPAHTVYTDNAKAAQQLTDYLFERGHQQIAFLSPPPENTSTIEDRIQGYTAAFVQRGRVVNPQHLMTSLLSTLPGALLPDQLGADEQALAAYIDAHRELTAFVACEYNIALMVLHALTDLHGQLPQDYTIVCFDSPDSRFEKPRFTHIRQNEKAMGRTAVDLLLAQFEGQQPITHKTIDFALVEGQIAAVSASILSERV